MSTVPFVLLLLIAAAAAAAAAYQQVPLTQLDRNVPTAQHSRRRGARHTRSSVSFRAYFRNNCGLFRGW